MSLPKPTTASRSSSPPSVAVSDEIADAIEAASVKHGCSKRSLVNYLLWEGMKAHFPAIAKTLNEPTISGRQRR